jgi:hypothetical protein
VCIILVLFLCLNCCFSTVLMLIETDVNNSAVFAFPMVTASPNIKNSLMKIISDFEGDLSLDKVFLSFCPIR